jgi:signal transduction histidine kinase
VADAISLFQEEADMKQISILFTNNLVSEKTVSLDVEKVMSCLVNVLSNSVKFTQQKGVINISLASETTTTTPQKSKPYTSIQRISVKSLSKSFNKFSSENHSEKYHDKRSVKRTVHLKSIISKRSGGLTSRKNSNQPLRYRISVTDTGIGVKEAKLRRIQQII